MRGRNKGTRHQLQSTMRQPLYVNTVIESEKRCYSMGGWSLPVCMTPLKQLIKFREYWKGGLLGAVYAGTTDNACLPWTLSYPVRELEIQFRS